MKLWYSIENWEAHLVKVRSSCVNKEHVETFMQWVHDLYKRSIIPRHKFVYNMLYCEKVLERF